MIDFTDECNLGASVCEKGKCVNTIGSYYCDCPVGYRGQRCETDINECLSNPCLNGNCLNDIGNYQCFCKDGFTGRNCETNIDDCASTTCYNQGTCYDLDNNYKCVCQPGIAIPLLSFYR